MRNSQHLKHSILTGFKGVNNDVTPELRSQLEGFAYDMINARIDPETIGEVFGIGGIEGTDHQIGNQTTTDITLKYVVDVDGMIVSLWNYSVGGISYGGIAVDTAIVAQSTDLIFGSLVSCDFSKEHHKLFVADGEHLPLILDIDDMVSNVATDKYFADFIRSNYSVTFNSEMSPPRFQQLADVGNGLKIGSYIYMYRYVDSEGNRTGWSIPSATIPVVMNEDKNIRAVNSSTNDVVGWKTYGGNPGEQSRYGIIIKLRIVNTSGFSYVEVGRFTHQSGGPFGDMAAFGVTSLLFDAYGVNVDISSVDVVNVDFMDSAAVVWEESNDFLISQLSSIESADAVRYFADRLVMLGIRYTDMDLSSLFSVRTSFKNDLGVVYSTPQLFPFLTPLGREGHRTVHNQVYKKSYIHRDRKKYAIIFDDGAGRYSQAIPLPDGVVDLPHASNGMTNYESVLTDQMHRKYKGITPAYTEMSAFTVNTAINNRVFLPWNDYSTVASDNAERTIKNDYTPYTPINKADPSVEGYTNRHETGAIFYRDRNKTASVATSAVQGYYPKQYSMGIALAGIDWENLPTWVKGFSIVQSESNGGVVAQGIAMYNITHLDPRGLLYSADFTGKSLDELVVHFPDLDKSIGISPSIVDDLIANPQNYSIQLMAPVGFFSEGYAPQGPTDDVYERDFLTFANVLRPGKTNPYDSGISGVKFGTYRNTNPNSNLASKYNSVDPNQSFIFNIVQAAFHKIHTSHAGYVKEMPDSRTTMLRIKLDSNVYVNDATSSNQDSNSLYVKAYHEPWYIVNLVKRNQGVESSNVSKFNTIGHHQALRYTIGVGSGSTLTVPLINDRISDYLYVNGKLWYLHSSDTDWSTHPAYLSLKTNSSYFSTELNNPVYGIARWRRDNNGNFEILFKKPSDIPESRTIPAVGDIIEMRYNKNSPIELMGGEYVVSESYAAYVDLAYGLGKGTARRRSVIDLNCGYPLAQYWSNLGTSLRMDHRVRQWVIQSILLTKTNIPFITNNAYPNRQYLIKMSSSIFHEDIGGDDADTLHAKENYISMAEKRGIDIRFVQDNLDQMPFMGYGGFVLPQMINNDYSKRISNSHYTIPAVGYTPVTYFPNRVIWSMVDDMITQDAPGIRTVLASAVYDTKSEYGKLVRAFNLRDVTQSKQSNQYIPSGDLYIVSRGGVCKLMTNRLLLNTLDDNSLSALPKEGVFVQREDWINASASIPEGHEKLVVERNDALYLVADDDIYTITGEGIISIGSGYVKKIREAIDKVAQGGINTWATAYDRFGEIIFMVGDTSLVYNRKIGAWVGTRTYDHRMIVANNKEDTLYGYDDLTRKNTDMYDAGATAREMQVSLIAADAPSVHKEFVDVNVISADRPDRVDFGVDITTPDSSSVHINNPTANNDLYMKHYGNGWWTYIPVKVATRLRQQGNYLIVTVRHTTNVKDFMLKLVEIGWKLIK